MDHLKNLGHIKRGERSLARQRSRLTAIYSFVGAVIVCVVLLASWRIVRSQSTVVPAGQRRLSEVTLTWRCPQGHEFEDIGSAARLKCPHCEKLSDMTADYVCPQHGDIPASIRMRRDESGRARLDRVSFRPGVWRPVRNVVSCPDCGSALRPKQEGRLALQESDAVTP